MTSRERMLLAINHKEADKVPHAIGGPSCNINLRLYAKLLDYFGIKNETAACSSRQAQTAKTSEIFMQKIGCDVRTPPRVTKSEGAAKEWENGDGYFFQDNWGTVFRMPKSEGHYFDLYKAPMEGCFDNDDDALYQFPALPSFVSAAVEQAEAYHAAGYPVMIPAQYGNGFLQTGPRIFGYEDWMMMLAVDDKRSAAFMEKLLEMKIKTWDMIIDAMGDSIDIIGEVDDLGTQNGPFVSPEMVQKKLAPYYKKLFDHIHGKTKAKIFFHSCGSVVKLIPCLIDAGVDILNPVQISAAGMEPEHLKKEFGKDITFWGGGIDTQKILPFGTKKQIRDQVKRNIEVFGKDGGYVFATVHNVQNDVPVENFITMWETLMEVRNY